MKAIFYVMVFLFTLQHAHAQSIPLENVSSDDMNKIVGDLSAGFLHTSVSGARFIGSYFSVSKSAYVATQTATPHLSQVCKTKLGRVRMHQSSSMPTCSEFCQYRRA